MLKRFFGLFKYFEINHAVHDFLQIVWIDDGRIESQPGLAVLQIDGMFNHAVHAEVFGERVAVTGAGHAVDLGFDPFLHKQRDPAKRDLVHYFLSPVILRATQAIGS